MSYTRRKEIRDDRQDFDEDAPAGSLRRAARARLEYRRRAGPRAGRGHAAAGPKPEPEPAELFPGADHAARRADRALSGSAPDADPDGLDLSARGGRTGAMVAR